MTLTTCLLLAAFGSATPPPPPAQVFDKPGVKTVRVSLRKDKKPGEVKRAFNATTAARKLFQRYLDLSAWMAPLTLERGPTKSGDFQWYVAINHKKDMLVFITANPRPEPLELRFDYDGGMPLEPTYRRVFSTDNGKTWRKMAFEKPHNHITNCPASMREPFTIEVPGCSYQTATVRIK